ncbi:N-6 DNA methylase [Pedobacter sp. LMG 31464]|uniref:site-specific DNA-methyltransferase (adenine-specific) n=1 Tax=Pedobacter planticolens TaxID=2679964 RepID=A0A923IWE7_9SPHI|nr:N-6 DNA methylase [Pedobacter planticolens]MBB2146833.1 N-6 DNA methylase [Pedobacter planticolens]
MPSVRSIHQQLGYDISNGLFNSDDVILQNEGKLSKLFSKDFLKPNSIFYIGDRPFVLFYENPDDKSELFKAIWNINEVPVIIIFENNTTTIYNGFEYLKETKSLSVLGGENELSDFEYFKIVTGQTWEKYELSLSYKKRVDFKLLENIKVARSILINKCGLSNYSANALLGKTIFTRYLIDRQVRIGFNSEPKVWTTEDYCNVLNDFDHTLNFFSHLEQKFKGNLFEIDDPAQNLNQNALNVVIDLLNGVELINYQTSMFDVYDFSIIPVEFISNVYEMFIGEKEQAINGSYYTPLFLVDYINSQTVKKFFELSPKSTSCAVLDPACGSGIFLVETLRVIIEKYNLDNPSQSRGSTKYRNGLVQLTKTNIFGIDKDESALSVAIFSIYLTLLDYQSPRDIENFEFPALLGSNFFAGDFFMVSNSFNEILSKIKFNFIIGNPPWKRGGGKGKNLEPYELYIKNRKTFESKTETIAAISNKEIAQAFLLRAGDFCNSETIVSFIVTSKTLYNLNAKDFRKYFFKNFFIDRIFELSPVRREVFDKSNDPAIAPAAVIFYRYAHLKSTDENLVEHFSIKPNRFFSLFKLFLIQRNDVKSLKQSLLLEYDWILKVLLYGNFNDFYFIKRLKEYYTTISEYALLKDCLIGQGVILNGNRKLQDASYLIGKRFVRTKEDVEAFNIDVDDNRLWTEPLALYPRDRKLFNPPQLLITAGISTMFRGVSAINYEKEIVFKSSLTAIQSSDINFLETACGFLNSSLFSYYALITTSSAGVEREETHDKEKLGFPFKTDIAVASIVKEIHQIKTNLREVSKKIMSNEKDDIQIQLRNKISELDVEVLNCFGLDETEESLVDYAIQFSIPSLVKSNSSKLLNGDLKFNDPYLGQYIKAFTDKFVESFLSVGKNFMVEVWYSKHLIGIFFKIQEGKKLNETKWVNKYDSDIIKSLIGLGHEKITDLIFMQKDVRGFEEDSFYIFKPNEKKVWHKAMAYLDLNDFLDAILKAGGQEE